MTAAKDMNATPLDEPVRVIGIAGPEPDRWWETQPYRRMSPGASGGRRFTAAKHQAPDPEED